MPRSNQPGMRFAETATVGVIKVMAKEAVHAESERGGASKVGCLKEERQPGLG